MAEPIAYQTPLPPGKRLRCLESEGVLRISLDSVGRLGLWWEVAVRVFAALLLVVGGAAMVFGASSRLGAYPYRAYLELGLVAVGLPAALVVLLRDLRHNAGIVSEIAVAGGRLTWKARTLRGVIEQSWPVDEVREARLDPADRSLKIYPRRGTELRAFRFVHMGELAVAAFRINHAMAARRAPEVLPPDPTAASAGAAARGL